MLTLTVTGTLTVAAQTGRQLKVYIKGGLVDKVQVDGDASIGHSRTDLNGTVHDDFVSMVITDSEGRERQYLISQLDSLVMPNGQRVVFIGNVNGNDNGNDNGNQNDNDNENGNSSRYRSRSRSNQRRTSFDGQFPGTAGDNNVTFFWTENDHIRLDVGDESRAVVSQDKTSASFIFKNTDLNAQSYLVYYPDKSVTIPSEQTQTGPNNTDHIGRSGDCGIALATRNGNGNENENDNENENTHHPTPTTQTTYTFTLKHKVAYLCFLPHIDHLPSVKLTKIRLEASVNNVTDAYPSGAFQLSENGLYSGKNYSRTITLNLKNTDGSDGFFIGHNLNTAKDECSAYMVVAPQGANVHYAVTYYLTDTLSRMTRTYVQRFAPGALVANTVYPVGCHIPDHLFRSIDLGLSKRWSSVNVGADVPSQDGMEYSTWAAAEAALLTDTKVTQWVKPTDEEKQELLTKCSWTRGSYNGSSGWFVTGAAAGLRDGQIHRLFIPAAANLTEAQSLEQHYRPVEALMVDLGLSDRSLWAVRNIGAGSADDYGEFYSWGELAQKSFYSYRDYAYYKSNGNTWINIGTNRDISGTEYDAAHMLWGGAWHIPSRAEWQVLMNECDWVWTTDFANGHNGYLITSRQNGRTLFLPAAGNLRDAGSVPDNANVVAQYPTSERSTSYADYIWAMNCHYNWNSGAPYFGEGSGENHQYRAYGRVIRPVATGKFDVESLKLNINTTPSDWTFGDETATLRGTISSPQPLASPLTVGFVVGDSVNIDIDHCANNYEQQVSLLGSFEKELSVFANLGQWYKAYVKVGDEYYYGQPRHYAAEMVDLGLPSKTLWANINVGANREGDFGNYYAWGETVTKDSYTLDNYKWRANGSYIGISENISGTKYDAALAVMGPLWQMPTKEQYEELLEEAYVSRELVDYQSSICWKFTSKKDSTKFIYLPKGGQRDGSSWANTDHGIYLIGNRYNGSYNWYFRMNASNQPDVTYNDFYKGQSVRAVARAKSDETDERIVEVTTDEADWSPTPGASKATLHGSFVSNMPLDGPAKVGFVVGDSTAIDTAHYRLKTAPQTLTREGSFASEVDIYDNLGYWYRAYVAVDDTVYYGEAQQYGMVYVDLGLPSKTLWANMNVGARSPIEPGGYYSWGEIVPKTSYYVSDYIYNQNNAWIDISEDIAGTQYDAATQNLGTLWQLPTHTQCNELISNCTWSSVLIDGQWCWKVQSTTNSNYILIPRAGYKYDDRTERFNDLTHYLSSTRWGKSTFYGFYPPNINNSNYEWEKRMGWPVRAVVRSSVHESDYGLLNVVTDTTSWHMGQGSVTLRGKFNTERQATSITAGFILGDSVNIDYEHRTSIETVTPAADGTFSKTLSVHDNHGYWYRAFVKVDDRCYYGEVRQYGLIMIDLGLPTKTLWANINLGADDPIESGDYYSWGETKPKSSFYVADYTYYQDNAWVDVAEDIAGTQYDAATQNLGTLWQLPSLTQCNELISNCTWSSVLIDNVWCWKVQSKTNGNYIIIPRAGYKYDDRTERFNDLTHYLSSTRWGKSTFYGFYPPNINNSNYEWEKRMGWPVRAVVSDSAHTSAYGLLNVVTDTTTWQMGQGYVTLRGKFNTERQATSIVTGFILGDSVNIDYDHCSGVVTATPAANGTFSKTLSVYDNQGHWYRAFVRVGDRYYYGQVRQYGLLMVDLGLPNGTLWANVNLDAELQQDFGGYYSWGETKPKTSYYVADYIYYQNNNWVDIGDDIAGTQYDAATQNFGTLWQLPSLTQCNELISNCTWSNVLVENVCCWKVQSKTNSNYIIIPRAGFKYDDRIERINDLTHYLSSTRWGNSTFYGFYPPNINNSNYEWEKREGFPVRAVANRRNQTVGGQTINVTTHDNDSWSLSDTQVVLRGSLRTREPFTGTATVGFVVGDRADLDHATMLGDLVVGPVSDTCTFTKTVTVVNHEGRYYRAYVKIGQLYYYGEVRQYGLVAVDLGLPSKTKWANMNLGAARPEEPGGYFAWGDTVTKSEYFETNYIYNGQGLPTDISGNVNYDAATYNWGSGWEMPTKTQFEELYNTTYCDHAFVMVNGQYCYRLTSKTNGRMLYIPMGGVINGTTLNNESWWAFYWTATRSSNTTNAWRTNFYGQSSYGMVENARWVGLNIRPVRAN